MSWIQVSHLLLLPFPACEACDPSCTPCNGRSERGGEKGYFLRTVTIWRMLSTTIAGNGAQGQGSRSPSVTWVPHSTCLLRGFWAPWSVGGGTRGLNRQVRTRH